MPVSFPSGRALRACVACAALAACVSSPAAAQPFALVTPPAIASHVAFSLGATWVDADQDGDLDLYVVTGFSANNANVYYRNDGGGTFVNVTGIPIALDFAETACSTWADYDNDGDVDAFVSNLVDDGGMLFDGQGGGDLVANAGAGLGGAAQMGTGCAWGDYDNDGRLDLVIAALAPTIPTRNRLFHNQGGGVFAEVVNGPLGSTVDSHHHVTWSDYDGDGDLDLFFATGPVGSVDTDRMYRNQLKETGTATFVPITGTVFATDARDSQGLTWVDYDNDGDLDLYAINYTSVPNQLYRNDAGTFVKITTGSIVTDAGAAHGVAWGDFDLDGDLDVYVARDNLQHNRYYRNNGDGTFSSITTGAFVTDGVSNYGATAGDYDGDGDLDLFAPTARSEAASRLFRNDLATGNHWLVVRGVGTTSNRSGVGAKVRVRAVIGGVPRWQMREILASGGYGGHGPLEAHFGLGDAVVADSVRIEWPGGVVDVLTGVAADQRLVVPEASTLDVEPAAPAASLRLTCAPTPTTGGAMLRFRLPHAVNALVTLHDAAGRRIATLRSGALEAGDHRVEIDATRLARPGIYWARLAAGPLTRFARVVRIR